MKTYTNVVAGNQPEKKFRAGGVAATVWLNQGQNPKGEASEYRTISLERSYKDKKTDTWKSTNSFRVNDLPKAALVITEAYKYLALSNNADAGNIIEEVIMYNEKSKRY